MGKAFVAKLAKQGARDPEALAAWIGRKKHGAAAFKKLAVTGRKGDKGNSSKPSATDRKMTREERVQVGRLVADLWSEKAFNRADAQTPQVENAASREDVLKRRAIEKARRQGVVRGDLPEWQIEQIQRSRGDRRVVPGSGEIVRPESRESQQRAASVRQWAAATVRAEREREAQERSARTAPSTEQEQQDIDRAAAGLVARPDMFARLDERLPKEADARTRQEVIQRRAVEAARRRTVARR
ncbi:hypothetical protein [Streptomyces coffeae]|uniref:Uncharacterized protein n=1 Tax=Streptomyces coffeae TaxID=621382 RepID=A0ABS1NJF9_9ACTN|nr:hypothetical protein [Streptomyces coffeae]MBL1100138.1 hypothetical protein [Streptomyces coffeae]